MAHAHAVESPAIRSPLRAFPQAARENVKGTLRSRSQFRRVYDEGTKRVGRFAVVFALPAEETRVGVVASRKVGGAVQRNRAKRLLRTAYRQCLPSINAPTELILVARGSLVDPELRSGVVAAELRAILKGLGLISRNSGDDAVEGQP